MLSKNGKGSDPKTTMLIVLIGILIGGLAVYFVTTFLPKEGGEETTQTPAPESTPGQTQQPLSEESSQVSSSEEDQPEPSEETALTLSSSAFDQNGQIPKEHTCESAEYTYPPLTIENVPSDTHSFALLFTKQSNSKILWGVYDIPPNKTELDGEKTVQVAKTISTEFGTDYVGPCPSEKQEYSFTLYALDDKTNLPSDHPISPDKLKEVMEGHIIAKTSLEASFTPSEAHDPRSEDRN